MTQFDGELIRADGNLKRARTELTSLIAVSKKGDPDEMLSRSLRFVDASERLLLHAREIPIYTGNPNARNEVETISSQLIGVKITQVDGWFYMVIPALLPKKNTGSAIYLRMSLYAALTKHYATHERPSYRECTLVVRHRYDKGQPERQLRDHDNIELKAVIDALAMFVLIDDSPLLLPHYYCTKAAQVNATEIMLIPSLVFPNWLAGMDDAPIKA